MRTKQHSWKLRVASCEFGFSSNIGHRTGIFLLLLISQISYLTSAAQTIHFSQFGFNPVYASAAYTNLMDGDYRFNVVYRNQWANVPVNYNSVSASAEMNFFQFDRGTRLGGGIQFQYDRAGDSRFTYMKASVPISAAIQLGKRNFLSFAVQPGFLHRNFDTRALQFDNQYTGDAFDSTIAPNESFNRNSAFAFDIGMGVAYQYAKNARNGFQFGFNYGHINQPSMSFFNDSEVRMGSVVSFHLKGIAKLSERLDIVPEYFYRFQGASAFLGDVNLQEHMIGTYLRTYLENTPKKKIAINLGMYCRVNPRRPDVSINNVRIDALWPLVGMEYNTLKVNVTYDINLSSFTPATRNNGGVEVSLIYEISRVKKFNKNNAFCPVFL